MEKYLTEDRVVLYAEFRKSNGTPSPGVIEQFDMITRDMMANATAAGRSRRASTSRLQQLRAGAGRVRSVGCAV